ncbi:UvrD-helicase domain-containing protein [Candidatus Poriferisodalis sp.]|uniref:UvrD-helicase domain-containing protein n=1 Tax=Candidatus Poriferisodalis sp. TaxID=3101277 RepID=UPI003B0110B3
MPDEWSESRSLSDTLIVAPPGCGKTELLAQRAANCIRMGLLPPGRRILALTFLNRSRANVASRLLEHLGGSRSESITVLNFHGLAAHLYGCHPYILDDPLREKPPDTRKLDRILRSAFKEYDVPPSEHENVRRAIRIAKSGAYSDDEVTARLQQSNSAAAMSYEAALRSDGLMDHDDVLRMGLRVIQHPLVAELYSERFAYLLVDEVQDLTRVQYQLIEPIGTGCTAFAGDRAQGIYAFAGADPTWVYAQIEKRTPQRIELKKSYRSSPEVLQAVSSIAKELGGSELESAEPSKWRGRGKVEVMRFRDPEQEADWLCEQIGEWQSEADYDDQSAGLSVGILSRMKAGPRRQAFLRRANASNLQVEIWDYPLHQPMIINLLKRHVGPVVRTVAEEAEQYNELYLRCFEDLAESDVQTQIELRDAIDELLEQRDDGSLQTRIQRIRSTSAPDIPVGPGVHLLTGHAGKGQGYDRVVILGFEEGQIPSFFVKGLPDSDPAVREELALLHVMMSRARETLLFTICQVVNGYSQKPSRWLGFVKEHAELIDRS